MAKRQFTEEELAFLRRNPYTAYVDENTLSFTVPFKIEYMRLHNKGVPPREILPRLGYPIEIIGKSRLVGISQKVRGEAESKLGFREPKHKRMAPLLDVSPEVEAALTDRQMINRLQCEVAYLHQEIDFLKKISAVDHPDKQGRWLWKRLPLSLRSFIPLCRKRITSSIYRPCASWQVFPGPGIIDG